MSATPTLTPSERVAWYYDQNTRRFLRFGGSGAAAAIHRQIWAPEVENPDEAFLYLNRLVAVALAPAIAPALAPEMLSPASSPRLLDLGCGVGGTSTWLAQRLGVAVTGVTNSAVQQQLAVERAERLGLSAQCQFLHADFLNLPDLKPVNAAYAIEAFIHASDPQRFFAQVARQLPPGGRLVICDDFLSESAASPQASQRSRRWVQRFMRGWHLNSLLPVSAVTQMAEQAGFRLLQAHDLTPYLRQLHPLLLWAITFVTQLPLRSAYWQNLAGGTALQVCSRRGWTRYQALVWEKRQA